MAFFPPVLSRVHVHFEISVNPPGNLVQNLIAVVVKSPFKCQLETFMASLYPFVFVGASPPTIREKIMLALGNHIFPLSLLCKSKPEQIFLSSVTK